MASFPCLLPPFLSEYPSPSLHRSWWLYYCRHVLYIHLPLSTGHLLFPLCNLPVIATCSLFFEEKKSTKNKYKLPALTKGSTCLLCILPEVQKLKLFAEYQDVACRLPLLSSLRSHAKNHPNPTAAQRLTLFLA